jgi:outer membrane immunogenic protein
MLKQMIALVSLGGLLAGNAVAADLPAPPYSPAAASAMTWAGFHVGAVGGWARATGSQDQITTVSGTVSTGGFSQSGWIAGGTIGYDWQFGTLVAGVEGDLSGALIEGGNATGACALFHCNTNIDWLHTGRARLGMAWGPIMPYITGGIAAAGLKAVNMNNPTGAQPNAVLGGVVGGGVEWAFLPHWSVKAEYLYIPSFGSRYAPDLGGTLTERNVNLLRFGVNYRLWDDGPLTARY